MIMVLRAKAEGLPRQCSGVQGPFHGNAGIPRQANLDK
jgi:hypothetical protein